MTDWLFRVLKGALIGTGAILPGISGGALCVVLGVYRQMMAFLSHPVQGCKQYGALLLPVLVGWGIGVIGLARVVDLLFQTSKTPATWLFIGLVAGTLPSLYREAGSQGRPRSAWIALFAGAGVMAVFMAVMSGSGAALSPSFFSWVLCGMLWGLGIVVPGLSPSSLIVFFGLYQPMSAGIGALDLGVILPLAAGILATVALLAKAMNALLLRAHAVVMHAIVGVVVASTVGIVPLGDFAGWNIVLFGGCFLAGGVLAYAIEWIGRNETGKRRQSGMHLKR